VHRLVEVARAERVDRDELELGPLALDRRQPLGLGERVGRELTGQFELAAQRVQADGERRRNRISLSRLPNACGGGRPFAPSSRAQACGLSRRRRSGSAESE